MENKRYTFKQAVDGFITHLADKDLKTELSRELKQFVWWCQCGDDFDLVTCPGDEVTPGLSGLSYLAASIKDLARLQGLNLEAEAIESVFDHLWLDIWIGKQISCDMEHPELSHVS